MSVFLRLPHLITFRITTGSLQPVIRGSSHPRVEGFLAYLPNLIWLFSSLLSSCEPNCLFRWLCLFTFIRIISFVESKAITRLVEAKWESWRGFVGNLIVNEKI